MNCEPSYIKREEPFDIDIDIDIEEFAMPPPESANDFIDERDDDQLLENNNKMLHRRTPQAPKENSGRPPSKNLKLTDFLNDNQQTSVLNIILKELKEIKASIAALATDMEKMKHQQDMLVNESKLAATLIRKREVARDKKIFPIRDEEELKLLEEGPHEVVDIALAVREIIADRTLSKKIFSIFSPTIIMDFNYCGAQGKKNLSAYLKVNEGIFSALVKEGFTFDDYVREVKAAFKRAKNCLHKKRSIQRLVESKKPQESHFVAC